MNNIDTTIEKLKSSPLFYLFLSSRELFHSNFWFWLSTLNKTETAKLFSDKPITSDVTFKREHNQSNGEFKASVDLYVEDKIAIENKVKDFPTSSQLDRIKQSFGKSDIDFVLTTLFWTNDLAFEGWTVKTYRTISDSIEPKKFTNDSYYQSLITDYKQFAFNLSELSEKLEINQEYDFAISLNKDLFGKLNQIKLWEGYQKLRASHLLIHFAKSNTHNVSTAYGINNQKATIDFVIDLQDGYKLGIQIEDIQYRKFVIGKNAGKFAENLIENNLFLNNKFSGRGKKSYLKYGDSFKYQYEKIERLTFIDLFNKIYNDIQKINDEIDNVRGQIPSR
jgi:hypothetical protein